MVICAICLLAMWPLSVQGLAVNKLPAELSFSHSLLCAVLVFSIVCIYTFLFRNALIIKNQQIGASMKQLKETTQKLIQSEKMASLGVLSAGVAHEINNPLNFIKGGLEILEQELKNSKELQFEAAPSLHVIREGVTRAAAIVNSLNHFSRETEAMDEPCNIHEILDNSIVMLQPKLKYKGNVVKAYTKKKLVISGNEGKLHQAFINLIANAEQAIEKDGTITIRTDKKGKQVIVEIIDDGIGIPKEHLDKISDPFFTTKPAGQGTGLGLSITYKIIEMHNGEISVSSKEGKGTKFAITFKEK